MVTAAAAAPTAVVVAVAVAEAAAPSSEQIHSIARSQSSLFGKKHVAPPLYISELLQGAATLGEARPLPGSFPRKCPDRLTQKCIS